jgi:hypothetical protein
MAFRRRPGGLPYPVNLLSGGTVSATAIGIVASTLAVYGTHATVLYNAEALKTQVRSSSPGQHGPTVRSFVSQPPQVDLTQQSSFTRPSLSPSGKLGSMVVSAPQNVDLTQQSSIRRSIQSSPGRLGTMVVAPPQNIELTQQSRISPSAATVIVTKLGTFVVTAPQIDLTQQSKFYNIPGGPSGQVSGSEYQFGTHASALYNAEAIKIQFYPSVRPPPTSGLGTFVNVPQQVDLTQQSQIYKSVIAGQTTSIMPRVSTAPQLVDLTQQSQFYGIKASPSAIVSGSQYTFGTHSIALYNAEAIKTNIYPSVRPPPVVTGVVSTFINVPPQSVDLTQQSQIYPAASNPGGWILTWITSGPDSSEFVQFQSTIIPSSSGVLPAARPIKFIVSTPQVVDLTQQSSIYKPLLTFQGRVPPYTLTAPQLLDLTQQSVIQPSVPSPISYAFKSYTSGPQLVDLTIQSQIFPAQFRALIFGPTVFPNPFVPAQFDITVNGTRIWTPSTFSPSAPVIIAPQLTIKGGRVILSSKKPSEIIIEQVDFISQLGPGETILTAVCACSVYTGNDPNPSAMISGAATFAGSVVSQLVIGGILGTIYEFLATVTTNLGQKIELAGYLAVIPDLI